MMRHSRATSSGLKGVVATMLAALGLAQAVAAAELGTLIGTAAVIDGDTFRIGETVVRLFDIDAPELAQTCDGGPARLSPFGVYVADALAERFAGVRAME